MPASDHSSFPDETGRHRPVSARVYQSVDDIKPILGHEPPRLGLLPWQSADKRPQFAPDPARSTREGQTGASKQRVGAVNLWAPSRWRAPSTPSWVHSPSCLATGLQRGVPAARPVPPERRAAPRARESEMSEDSLNDGRVVDRGDELHPPVAARSAQDIDVTAPCRFGPTPASAVYAALKPYADGRPQAATA